MNASRLRPLAPAALLTLVLCLSCSHGWAQDGGARQPVSVSGVIVIDDDGAVIIQDDTGVDYLVHSPDLSPYSGEGVIGEGVTWPDEDGEPVLELSKFEIIEIMISPEAEPDADTACPAPDRSGPVAPKGASRV